MKFKWIDTNFVYDGSQLQPLFAYMGHGLLGDSLVAWIGPCDIPFAHMVDGEDVRAQSVIRGGQMLHFIAEIFPAQLTTAVALQRLFTAIVKDVLSELTSHKNLRRDGDDIFWEEKKFSISIASSSPISSMIHFAVNVTNENTPVATCALEDFKLEPKMFAEKVAEKITREWRTILEATQKVRPL